MKALFVFLFTIISSMTVFAQAGNWTLIDSASITSPSIATSDTGHTGSGYRFAYLSTTPDPNASVVGGNDFSKTSYLTKTMARNNHGFQSVVLSGGNMKVMGVTDTLASFMAMEKNYGQAYTVPQKLGIWYFVPAYAAKRVTRIAFGFLSGNNTILATTTFCYAFNASGWQYVELPVNVPGGSFSALLIALSDFPNEGGSRVVFLDDLTLVNGSVTSVLDDGGGSVGSPTTPTITSPGDSAQYTLPALPDFIWSSETADTAYTLQVSTTATFTPLIVNVTQVGTSYQAQNLSPSVYYWRVRGINSAGVSAWTVTRNFTVSQITVPSAPQFSGIKNGDTVDTANPPTINWGSQPGWSVRILVLTTASDTVINNSVSNTSYVFSGLSSCSSYILEGRYEQGNQYSAWTIVGFTTLCQAPIPTLVSPSNGKINVNANSVALIWSPAGETTVLVSKDQSFTVATIVYSNAVNGNSVTISIPAFQNYYWKVGNSSGWSPVWSFYAISSITGVDDIGGAPKKFDLAQNYPNPFNPTTTIEYAIPKSTFVTLKIYDVLGQEVETLIDQEKNLGNYEVSFDASKLSSGIYFYKLDAGSFHQIKKMILMK